MDPEADSWINTPVFDWTPEAPLRPERGTEKRVPLSRATPEAPVIQLGAAAWPDKDPEPHFANTVSTEMPAAEPRLAISGARAPTADTPKAAAKPKPVRVEKTAPRTPIRIAVPSLSLFQARLAVGLAQGAGLFALFAARDFLNPYVFSSALMMLLFAPLLPLAGLGRMSLRPLIAWTGFAALLLAGVGAYHHWRTLSSDCGHPGLTMLALTGLFLFIGQSIAQGIVGDYASYYRSAWQLAIRIVFCALFAGLAWAAAGILSGLMRQHYPMLAYAPLVVPVVTLSAALAAHLTGEKLLGVLQEGLVFVFTMALPVLLLLGVVTVALDVCGFWHPSFIACAILALALIVAINASYRDGMSWRPSWRRRAEFAASLALVPLTLLATFALAARITQYGWSDGRIFAVAGLLMMGGYALCYAAAALIGLGGGSWMQRIEEINLALAFAALTLIAALVSPIADPARLAVAAQTFRLEQHQISPQAFDFTWLRDSGLRFGRDALTGMAAAKGEPATARGAFLALGAPPEVARPTPTQIGANIHVHSAMGLPASLLARDWSVVDNAPPCLTTASVACDAFFADLDNDGRSEILLAYGSDAHWWASVMRQGTGGGWYVAGTLAAPPCPGSLTALRAGHFAAVRPAGNWRDLLVDGIRLSIDRPRPLTACPTS